MKISAKLALMLVLGGVGAFSGSVCAQDTGRVGTLLPAAPSPVFATPAAQAPSPTPAAQAASPTPAAQVASAAPAAQASPISATAASPASIQVEQTLDDAARGGARNAAPVASGKVPDSVKDVVKRLGTTTNNFTLEDLNEARQAVAKLDVLIDIEKKISELARIRKDREEKSGGGISALNASSLLPRQAAGTLPSTASAPVVAASAAPVLPIQLPNGPDVAPPVSAVAPVYKIPQAVVTVDRVFGAGGRISASVKVGEAPAITVKEGDKLTDGSLVRSISGKGVVLVHDGAERTVPVKNVGTVFGAR